MIKPVRQQQPQGMASASGGRIAIIVGHFNYEQFDRPRQNLCRFARQMRSFGIPIYGAELHLRGTRAFTEKWDNWQQFETVRENLMFQKEALLNIVEKAVPESYDIIAWIDPDVMFQSRVWNRDLIELIDSGKKVVQLFDRAVLTNKDGTTFRSWSGCCFEQTLNTRTAHTGFAWAANRDLWRKGGGLYPYSITGSGDVIMASAFLGLPLNPAYQASTGLGSTHRVWHKRMEGWCDDYSYVSGTVFHEWHGDIKDRDYPERRDILKELCVETDLRLDSRGVLEWNPEATTRAAEREQIKNFLAAHWKSRKED